MFNFLPEQNVYICGTSECICSDLRVAYMVFGESLGKNILQAIFNINVKTSSLDIEVITEIILSGKAHEIVNQKKYMAQTSNKLYSKYFPDILSFGHPLSFYRWLPVQIHYNALGWKLI